MKSPGWLKTAGRRYQVHASLPSVRLENCEGPFGAKKERFRLEPLLVVSLGTEIEAYLGAQSKLSREHLPKRLTQKPLFRRVCALSPRREGNVRFPRSRQNRLSPRCSLVGLVAGIPLQMEKKSFKVDLQKFCQKFQDAWESLVFRGKREQHGRNRAVRFGMTFQRMLASWLVCLAELRQACSPLMSAVYD